MATKKTPVKKPRKKRYVKTDIRPGTVKDPDADQRVKKTQHTLTLLKQAASLDCPWVECAYYAGISEKTLYEWFKDGEEGKKLRNELERLKQRPVLKARERVVIGINESYGNAMDYLSRKKALEFGNKAKIEHDISINHKEEARKRVGTFRDRISNLVGGVGEDTR